METTLPLDHLPQPSTSSHSRSLPWSRPTRTPLSLQIDANSAFVDPDLNSMSHELELCHPALLPRQAVFFLDDGTHEVWTSVTGKEQGCPAPLALFALGLKAALIPIRARAPQ